MEKEQSKMLKQEAKGKAMLEHEENDEKQKQVGKKKPRTKGLKRALRKEKDQNLLDEDLDIEDIIALEINEDREYWLGKVNGHLYNLIEKDNRDN